MASENALRYIKVNYNCDKVKQLEVWESHVL